MRESPVVMNVEAQGSQITSKAVSQQFQQQQKKTFCQDRPQIDRPIKLVEMLKKSLFEI